MIRWALMINQNTLNQIADYVNNTLKILSYQNRNMISSLVP